MNTGNILPSCSKYGRQSVAYNLINTTGPRPLRTQCKSIKGFNQLLGVNLMCTKKVLEKVT